MAPIYYLLMVMSCKACHRELITCLNCKNLFCTNCNNIEFLDIPKIAKGWCCVACLLGDTELHKKIQEFSESRGSPDKLLLVYKQTTLF
jgi:hypothetical protein